MPLWMWIVAIAGVLVVVVFVVAIVAYPSDNSF